MSREGIGMRKVKEIIRLNESGKLSQNAIAKSCKVSSSTVGKVLKKLNEKDVKKQVPGGGTALSEEKIQAALKDGDVVARRDMPEMEYIAKELKRKGVTRYLLWEEYHDKYPAGYSYSQFCYIFQGWKKNHAEPTMRFEHKAGEKMFVDWAGDKLYYMENGIEKEGHLFVAVLGASNYTFTGVYPDEKLPNWIQGHVDAYRYFGGVSLMTVPDNPKTGVKIADKYDPELTPAYYEMAEHFGTVIMPARPGKPRDKAKAENAVLFAERWIIGALRNRQFLSFGELVSEVRKKNDELNRRPFGKMDGNRENLFNEIEKKELKPLPEREFSIGEWKKAIVHIDYHVQLDNHFYSVHWRNIGKEVEARMTATTVEIFLSGERIAIHQRSYEKNKATTLKEHMPEPHSMYLAESTDKLIGDAAAIGPSCQEVVTKILEKMPRPEMGYRSCLGIIRLAKKYGADRLEKACSLALKIDSFRYRDIDDILKKKMENSQPFNGFKIANFNHCNVRGGNYYSNTRRASSC